MTAPTSPDPAVPAGATAPLGAPDDRVLDARGLRCPLPVIRLAALLGDLPTGTEVVLLATDPAARSDVAAFCRMRGHELLLVEDHRPSQEADYTAYRVRRGA